MEPSRKAALAKGEARYFTGQACHKGHTAPRRAATGECLQCRADFLVLWRRKNPARVQVHNAKQYKIHGDKIILAVRRYYSANKVARQAQKREYQKKNLHVYAQINAKRKAAKLKRTPKWLTPDDFWMMEQAYELAALRTKVLGFPWHVDHVIPLQGKIVSGLHVPLNLRVIPAVVNRSKWNKFEENA
jgi:hypothetical protein